MDIGADHQGILGGFKPQQHWLSENDLFGFLNQLENGIVL